MHWLFQQARNYWTTGNPLVRAGQLAQVLRQFVIISVALLLPRLSVSITEIGYWEQMQYLGYLLGFAFLTGTGQAYLARIRTEDELGARQLTSQLLRITLGFSIGICLLFFLFQSVLLPFLLSGDGELPGWPFYLVFLLAHWPGLMYEQVLLAQKKAKRLFWFSLVSNFSLLFALLLPLYLGHDWSDAIKWLLLVSILKAIFLIDTNTWTLGTSGQKARRPKGLGALRQKDLLSQSVPLIAYAATGAIIVSFDPWLVNYWYEGDETQFAIYRYGTRELPLIVAITNGISVAVLPEIGHNIEAGLAQLRSSTLRLMHLFFPATMLLLFSSPWWWEPLFTERFSASLPLFQIFLFYGVSRFLLPTVIITGTGHRKALLGIGGIEFVLNAVLSVWLVSTMGLPGIVWATIIAYTIDKLIACWYIYYKEGVRLNEYCAWQWLVGYTILLGGAYWLVSSSTFFLG